MFIIELVVDIKSLGDEAHQVPVLAHHGGAHVVQHPGLAVVLAVAVRIAVVSKQISISTLLVVR